MSWHVALSVIAGVVAVAQIERKGALQAMLSRPLVLGAVLGALLGDLSSGLLLGSLLELLWLGALNIGAHLPDNEVVGTGAVVGAAMIVSGGDPVPFPLATLSIVLLAPLSMAGKRVDLYIEKSNVALVARARRRLEAGRSPGPVNLAGLLAPAISGSILAVAGAGAGGLLLSRLLDLSPAGLLSGLEIAFPLIAAACTASALAAVSTSRSRLYAAAAAAIALVWVAAGGAWSLV